MPTVTAPPSSPGILGALRAFGDGLLASAQERIELLAVELQEEKYRLIQLLIWISAAIFAAALAVIFASLTLVVYFWDSARLTVLGGLTLGYAALFTCLVIAFRRYLARQPRPFAASLQELKEDRTCIPKRN